MCAIKRTVTVYVKSPKEGLLIAKERDGLYYVANAQVVMLFGNGISLKTDVKNAKVKKSIVKPDNDPINYCENSDSLQGKSDTSVQRSDQQKRKEKRQRNKMKKQQGKEHLGNNRTIENIKLWHSRMTHLNVKSLKKLGRNPNVFGLEDTNFSTCRIAKSTRASFPVSTEELATHR
uniref:Uncharacterized protein n=1 Tax=Strigamia maritima TaxID=126957 RepID=T1IU75_STRMM